MKPNKKLKITISIIVILTVLVTISLLLSKPKNEEPTPIEIAKRVLERTSLETEYVLVNTNIQQYVQVKNADSMTVITQSTSNQNQLVQLNETLFLYTEESGWNKYEIKEEQQYETEGQFTEIMKDLITLYESNGDILLDENNSYLTFSRIAGSSSEYSYKYDEEYLIKEFSINTTKYTVDYLQEKDIKNLLETLPDTNTIESVNEEQFLKIAQEEAYDLFLTE